MCQSVLCSARELSYLRLAAGNLLLTIRVLRMTVWSRLIIL